MTGDEVRRRPRLSKRREAAVMEIADVCRESGLDGSGPASVDDMLSSHQQAKVLRQQLEALDLVRARLDAKRLFIEADSRASRVLLLRARAECVALRPRAPRPPRAGDRALPAAEGATAERIGGAQAAFLGPSMTGLEYVRHRAQCPRATWTRRTPGTASIAEITFGTPRLRGTLIPKLTSTRFLSSSRRWS